MLQRILVDLGGAVAIVEPDTEGDPMVTLLEAGEEAAFIVADMARLTEFANAILYAVEERRREIEEDTHLLTE